MDKNDITREYDDVMKCASKLFKEKATEYESERFDIFDYFLHGIQDAIYEIYKDTIRLVNLSEKENYAAMEDKILDLINYAVILYILIEKNQYKSID